MHPPSFSLLGLLCLAAAALGPYGAQAQPAPDGPRAQLERVRAARPTGIDASVFESIAYQLDVADRIDKDYPVQAQLFRARAASWLSGAPTTRCTIHDFIGTAP